MSLIRAQATPKIDFFSFSVFKYNFLVKEKGGKAA